jgi:hypothetical protein
MAHYNSCFEFGITTEELSYIAGIISCKLASSSNYISFKNPEKKDINIDAILNRIIDVTGAELVIGDNTRSVLISGNNLKKHLRNLQVPSSLCPDIASFASIRKDLVQHFVRGYSEICMADAKRFLKPEIGKGCCPIIKIGGKGKQNFKTALMELLTPLDIKFEYKSYGDREDPSIQIVDKEEIHKFYDFFYKDATIFDQNLKTLLESCIERLHTSKYGAYKDVGKYKDIIINLLSENKTQVEIANHLNVDVTDLRSYLISNNMYEVNSKSNFEDLHLKPRPENSRLQAMYKLPQQDDAYDNLWMCKCDCGNTVIAKASSYLCGHKSSCGCLKIETARESIKVAQEKNRIYKDPSIGTATRIHFKHYNDGDVTFEKFLELSKQNCHYCGVPPSNNSNVYKNGKRASKEIIAKAYYIYNGLDRVDNSRGHYIDNVVPCCRMCNYSKRDSTLDSFQKYLTFLCAYSIVTKRIVSQLSETQIIELEKKIQPLNQCKDENIYTFDIGIVEVDDKLLCKCCGNMFAGNISDYKYKWNCGCLKGFHRRFSSNKLDRIEFRRVFQDYDDEGDLTLNDITELTTKRCTYCGAKPKNIRIHGEFSKKTRNLIADNLHSDLYKRYVLLYNGIDRVDNKQRQHNKDNCVTCCKHCNIGKRANDVQTFYQWIQKIYDNYVKPNNLLEKFDSLICDYMGIQNDK